MKPLTLLLSLILTLLIPTCLLAHAQLDHANPAVGSTVAAPSAVTIFYTEEINPDVSKIEVQDAGGKAIDKKDSHLDARDKTILIVSLPSLSPGTYKVIWHVECCDSHKTDGDFKFTVK